VSGPPCCPAVIPDGRLVIQGEKIVAVLKSGDPLPAPRGASASAGEPKASVSLLPSKPYRRSASQPSSQPLRLDG